MIFALAATLLFGFAALVLEGGRNFVDKRALQAASDLAALAGGQSLGDISGSCSLVPTISCDVLNQAEKYAWDNVHVNPGSIDCSASSQTIVTVSGIPHTENVCRIPATGNVNGYVMTATYPYVPRNPAMNPWAPEESVAFDISHINPQAGLASIFGVNSVSIVSHAAAHVTSTSRLYPFALATRYLDLTGNGEVDAFGAVLVGECSADGTGNFVDNSFNGGVFFNGGTKLVLGRSMNLINNVSPQAVLLADGNSLNSCTSKPNQNQDSNINGGKDFQHLTDKVNFTPCTGPGCEYSYPYAFNAGPPGCGAAPPATPAFCQTSPIGDGTWQDNPCWTTPKTADISVTNQFYNQATDTFSPVVAPTPFDCTTNLSTDPNTHEGSFIDSNWPGFPPLTDPVLTVNSVQPNAPIPANVPGCATNLTQSGTVNVPSASGSCKGGQVYTKFTSNASSTSYFESGGWYVFDGSAASVDLKTDTFACVSKGPVVTPVNGCVFVFRNGAHLSEPGGSGSSAGQIICSSSPTFSVAAPAFPGGYSSWGNCSMQFQDSTLTSPAGGNNGKPQSYLSIGGHTDVNIAPATATSLTGTANLPIVWSNDALRCIGSGPFSSHCAIDISGQDGSFKVGGTFFAPHGIVNLGQNASTVSGQVIADTIELQAGASALSSGVAYKSSVLAPVPGAPLLFE